MRNKTLNSYLCIALLWLAQIPFLGNLQAQSTLVKGTVLDAEGGMPGVNVTVKGTTNGTITDIEGNFSISVPDGSSVLIFSYIGYVTEEVTVGNQTQITVTLTEDARTLDEVVVVGYGVQKKSHLTGSVSKLDTDNLTDIPVTRVDQVLQGKIAGVNIQNSTSEAGAAPQIRVRGMGSISADSSPLVVIDGYPTPDGLETLDMADVESIEVLKDAASAAIYGSRAANGVILVTTKQGDFNRPRYNVKASTGLKWAYQLHPIMNSREYVDMLAYEAPLRGVKLNENDEAMRYINNHTNWQKQGLNSAPQIHQVQLSVSGGKKDLTYYVSGNFVQEDGIMIDSKYTRMNMRSRIHAKLTNRMDFSLNIAPSYNKTQTPSTNFIDFYRVPSFMPVRHTEETAALTGKPVGSYAHGRDFNDVIFTREDGTTFTAKPFQSANNNPRSLMDNEKRYREDYNLQTNAAINIELAKGLIFTTSNGFFFRYRQNNEYRNYEAKKDGESAQATYKNRLYIDLLSENTLHYTGKKGKHDYAGLVGYTAQTTIEQTAGIVGLGFPTDYIHTLNAATVIDLEGTNTFKYRTAMMSVLARFNYGYAEKYLFSASIRTDGSSMFAPGHQWGWFPSASVGWRASEEPFLKEVTWLDMLKLRASFGITGNNNIPANSYYDLLYPSNYVLGGGNGNLVSGLGMNSSTKGNREITWEQTYEYNAGIDFSAFQGRLNVTLEGYYSITKQLLFKQPVLSFMGYSDYWNNIGRIRNSGIELEVSTHNIRTKKFEWITSLNLSSNFNKLLELSGEERLISDGERSELYLAQVGKSAIAFFGYKTDGVWLSQEQIDNHPHLPGDVPGGLRIVDVNKDGVIDDKDRTVIGNPFPKLSWGMTNTFKWNNFDLYILIQGVHGLDVFNGDGYYNESKKFNRNYVKDRWLSPDFPGDGKTPFFDNGIAWQYTDYMIEDGSYIALRDVVLGYKFQKKQLRKMGLNSLRLYASGQNLLHFSAKNYRGINPEARMTSGKYASPLVDGYQRGGFPLQSTVTFGMEINF
ncbi:MAG: TonB-dependent receptor [Bacteroides sp.]|nr:TonB-dependent receptor [Bacteroides sp.]